MAGGFTRPMGMTQKIRESHVLAVLQRERLILAGAAANLGAIAMVVLHHG